MTLGGWAALSPRMNRHIADVPVAAARPNSMTTPKPAGPFLHECMASPVTHAHMQDKQALVVDEAVYTRNRAFRLYLSSKAGKQATLECTGPSVPGL